MITENDRKSRELRSGPGYQGRPPFFLPRFEDLLDRLLACLPLEESEEMHILQIGIDTGDLARRILEERVMSRLTVMDGSEDALRLFRACLKPFGFRIKTLCGQPEKHIGLQTYDAVLSHLCLHEIERVEDKTAVCRNVFASLRPGGVFAFSTVQPNMKRWATGSIRKTREYDILSQSGWRNAHAVPAEFWILWLEKIGFEKCRYFLHETVFGVYKARKPFALNA